MRRVGWQSDSPRQAWVNVRFRLSTNHKQFQILADRKLQWSSLTFFFFLNDRLFGNPLAANESPSLTKWPNWPGVSDDFLSKQHTSTQWQISLTLKPCAFALLSGSIKTLCGVTQTSLSLHHATFALSLLFLQGFRDVIKFIDNTRQGDLIGNDSGADTGCQLATKCTNKKFYDQHGWTFTWTFVLSLSEQSCQDSSSRQFETWSWRQAIICKSSIHLSIF